MGDLQKRERERRGAKTICGRESLGGALKTYQFGEGIVTTRSWIVIAAAAGDEDDRDDGAALLVCVSAYKRGPMKRKVVCG